VLRGNLFDNAIMKTSVISEEFRARYLSTPSTGMFEGKAVVFDGPEDYHHRIDDPALEDRRAHCVLFMRGAGPIGYPGAAEVVNMRPPDYLIKKRHHLAALHRRRPPVRHLGLALDPQRLARSGGRRRPRHPQDRRPGADRPQQGFGQYPDLRRGTAEAPRRAACHGRLTSIPPSQTPWQEIQRGIVDQLGDGMVLKPAVKYQRLAQTMGVPRDNH
jgi:dihydroxy-acid dehydratase